MTTHDAYRLLASVRRKLTVQQYRTIRGQIRAGDVDGAVRGIKNLTGKNGRKGGNLMDNYINVMVKHPGHPWSTERVTNELASFQALVGGYIETVPVDGEMLLLVNEEGKLQGLPANFAYGQDVLCGTVVAVGIQGDSFTSCPIRTDEGMRLAIGATEW